MTATVTIAVDADPARPEGGHAILTAQGHGLPAAASVRLAIRRGGVKDHILGPDGWQSSEATVTPERAEAVGGGLRLFLGPAIVNRLAGAPVIEVEILGAVPVRLRWPDIPPLEGADALNKVAAPQRQKPAPPLTGQGRPAPPPPPLSEPVPIEPAPLRAVNDRVLPAEPPRPRWLWPAAVAALLILIAAGLAAYWWDDLWPGEDPAALVEEPPAPEPEPPADESEAETDAPAPEEATEAETAEPPEDTATDTPDPEPPATEPPAEPAAGDPPATPSAPAQADLRDILRAMVDGAEAYDLGRDLLRGGDPDGALLAFERAGELAHAPGVTAQGEMYDPGLWAPDVSPFSQPYADRALRLYRDAMAAGDPAAADRVQALRDRLAQAATAGDAEAAALLADDQ